MKHILIINSIKLKNLLNLNYNCNICLKLGPNCCFQNDFPSLPRIVFKYKVRDGLQIKITKTH